jgi:hypothetical protein
MIVTGCSTAPKRPDQGGPAHGPYPGGPPPNAPVPGPTEVYGPPIPADGGSPAAPPANPADSAYGPTPVELRPVTLVFGPGMARGYVHEGVLRALSKRKVPIAAIYASEIGSLVAAIYAMEPGMNHLEWTLQKFKDDLFLSKPDMLHKFFEIDQEGSRLEARLKEVFGDRDLKDMKIPLKIAIQEKNSASPTVVEKGSVAQVLRIALASSGVFQPALWDGQPSHSATGPAEEGFLCDEAKAKGGNPVLLVDSGGGAHDTIRNADIVVLPNLVGLGEADFQKKTQAAFRGKRAVDDKIDEIRKWVGLPREPASSSGANGE